MAVIKFIFGWLGAFWITDKAERVHLPVGYVQHLVDIIATTTTELGRLSKMLTQF